MKAVGVKILKARLSEYLRMVKSGETVLVTERDEVVAELKPAHRQKVSSDDLAQILDDLTEQGRAVLRTQFPSSWAGPSEIIPVKSDTLRTVLEELRADS